MTDKTKTNLSIDLLENGIDFVLKGIDELFDDESILRISVDPTELNLSNFKYGILHVFSGFLLLLKERLYQHLPELIFKGKISEVREKVRNGKIPNTVDLDEILERLQIGPLVNFPENELEIIRRMQNFRNQFEHYKVDINKFELWETITQFLALVDTFLVDELEINLDSSATTHSVYEKIQKIELHWERIEKHKKAEIINELMILRKSFEENREAIIKDLEDEYFASKGYIDRFIDCPECNEETLIVYGEYAGVCSNKECSYFCPIATCDRCGSKMPGYPWDVNFCESCEADFARE